MAKWSENGTKINKTDGDWDLNNGKKFEPTDGIRASDVNKVVESAIYTQITSDEAKDIANHAKEVAESIQGIAENAVDIAENAVNIAESAVNTATNAVTTAEEAKDMAQEAKDAVAQGMGTIVMENNEPLLVFDADKKMDKTPKEPKVVSDAFLTRITATNDIEIIDSPLGVKTAAIKSIKGLSIKQVLQNGDFSDGTNGWTAHLTTLSVSNNVLTVTVNSLTGFVGFYGGGQPKSIANRPYYISAYINPKYANIVRIGYEDNPASFPGSRLVANQWNFVSAIVIPEQSGKTFIFYHYAASGYAVGDTFRVADVRCIDLVDSGLTGWTKEQLDAVIPRLPYWEGVRHSSPAQLKSIGDNLFDLQGGEFATQNSNYTLTGTGFIIETKSAGGTSSYLNYWYKLLPNTQYTLRWDAEKLISGSSNTVYVWGSRDQHLKGAIDGNELTFTTDNIGTGRFFFYSKTGTPDAIYKTEYSNVMLLHADNPLTKYKPYTEPVVELPQYTLRSLPDGTADEITPTHYIQRIDPETMTALEEPIYTPIEWDNTYPAWNYGLEQVFDADGNLTIAQMGIEYPLDLQKQVDTNTWIAQRNEDRIAQVANIRNDLMSGSLVAKIAQYASSDTEKGTIEERLTNLGFKSGSVSLSISGYGSIGGAALTRQGNYVIVRLNIQNSNLSDTPSGAIGTLPPNFRPKTNQDYRIGGVGRLRLGAPVYQVSCRYDLKINSSGVMSITAPLTTTGATPADTRCSLYHTSVSIGFEAPPITT